MRWHSFRKRLDSFLQHQTAEAELDDELNTHIELQMRKHIAAGMDPQEARRLARIEFGAVEEARESCREVDRWRWIEVGVRHLKQSFRSLAKSPGFVLIAILILTMAIGSNVAVFSSIDALFLRPLPVQHSKELVQIVSVDKQGRTGGLFSPVLEQLSQDRAFQGACGFRASSLAVEIESTLRTLGMAAFSGGCFETLGLDIQLGRALGPDDDRIGAEDVAVITDSLWHSQFGGRPDVLGRSIRIGTDTLAIAGVTGKQFTGLMVGFPESIIIPLLQTPNILPDGSRPTYYHVDVLARRAPGISEAQALSSLAAQKRALLEQSVPTRFNASQRNDYLALALTLAPASSGIDYFLRRRFAQPLYAVFGLCGAMLLMACVNLSSLLLARSLRRQREIAIRLALGARRGHIAGTLILENLVLVLAGMLAGITVGIGIARSIIARGGQMFGNFGLHIGLDLRVVLFAVAAVLIVVAIFSSAALWQIRQFGSADVLKQSGRSVIARNTSAQKVLIAVQVALSLALVTGSALLGASLKNMYRIDFGVKPHNVWEAKLAPRPGGYKNPRYWNVNASAYYRGLLQEIEELPDVASVSVSDTVPFFNGGYRERFDMLEKARPGNEIQAVTIGAADNYFATLGAKIVAGEDFKRTDSISGERGVILSESLARHWGDPRSLLGRHVRIGSQPGLQRLNIIGIVSDMDMSLANLNDTKPFTAFINFWQHQNLQGYPTLLIKTRTAAPNAAAIRRVVEKRGHEFIQRFSSIRSEIDNALIENVFLAYLSAAFGFLALVMAAVGLFGLLSYQVTDRTAEIGVRMVLGATHKQIRWLILSQITRLLLFGSLVGIALTIAIQKLIAGLLFGVAVYTPLILLSAIALLISTALAAAWIPTYRATTINPIEALRHD